MEAQRENVLDGPIGTLIVLTLVAVAAVDLLVDGVLSKDYERFVETIAWVVAPLLVARGFAARKPG